MSLATKWIEISAILKCLNDKHVEKLDTAIDWGNVDLTDMSASEIVKTAMMTHTDLDAAKIERIVDAAHHRSKTLMF